MGQHVSVDRDLVDLNAFLDSAPAGLPKLLGAADSSNVRHHVRAWKFQQTGRAVAVTAMPLHTPDHLFAADLSSACSYLILHVQAVANDENMPQCSCDSVLGLHDLAKRASSVCTPRGLTMNVVSQRDAWLLDDMSIRYSVFVWHGVDAGTQAQARAFTKAFEVERLLRSGSLQQRSQTTPACSSSKTVVLQGALPGRQPAAAGGGAASDGDEECTRSLVHQSGNQLLTSILSSLPKVSEAGPLRFPRLGRSVCHSFGVSPTSVLPPNAAARDADAKDASSRGTSATRDGSPDSLALAPVREKPNRPMMKLNLNLNLASNDSRSPVGAQQQQQQAPQPRGAPVIPRLQLGQLAANAPPSDSDSSMDVEAVANEQPVSGRKRGRSPSNDRRSKPDAPKMALSVAAAVGASAPKSARREHGATPRTAEEQAACDGQEAGAQGQRPVPNMRLPIPAMKKGPVIPALRLSADSHTPKPDSPTSDKSDAPSPAMLNLEEIVMSEDELIRSYDPDNEENNYHLPNHLRKQLQLDQYRQVCCEVLPGELYISSYQVASDLECLQRHGITHIVNTAADICDNCFPEQFKYLTYYLKDSNSEDLSPLFYRTLDWIHEAISGGGRVLVHCREGVSRSATMVIAYLMWRFTMPLDKAHETIRKTRPICNPNAGFTYRLILLGKKLGVGGCGNQSPPSELKAIFRVTPYHPKQPFLMLSPVDWPAKWPALDPRFGWVIQRGLQLTLWLGSMLPQADIVQRAVSQHVCWVAKFERKELVYRVLHEGCETPELWKALDLSASNIQGISTGAQSMYDNDFDILSGALLSPRSHLQVADAQAVTTAFDTESAWPWPHGATPA